MDTNENRYIVCNQVKCLTCNDTPFSMHRHHYATCDCGSVSVDGGQDYFKRSFTGKFGEMSIAIDKDVVERIAQKAEYSMDSGRNPLGVTLAVLRAIRDEGLVPEVNAGGITEWVSVKEKDKESVDIISETN